MIHCNNIISVCLALVVVFSSAVVFAENGNSASQQPSSQESADKQFADETKLRIGPGDPAAGMSKAALCFGCHGEDGNSTQPLIPKLAGQYGIYIAKQVRNYQDSVRTNEIMSAMAASVSDEDLADISAYFASQTDDERCSPVRQQAWQETV